MWHKIYFKVDLNELLWRREIKTVLKSHCLNRNQAGIRFFEFFFGLNGFQLLSYTKKLSTDEPFF
jgi:hypothetical protein